MPQPGKYGRRAPDLTRPAIRLDMILTGELPATPPDADYLAALNGGWAMLGNDSAGDCVAVTWGNVRRLVTTTLAKPGYYPSQADVWEIYKTQNPDFDPNGSADTNGPGSSADGGMDIQTLLKYLVDHGGPDGVKAVAFASVDPHDAAEVKAAIALFGYLWTGINVSAANEEEFSAGQPWGYDPASALEGGHSVITGGYSDKFSHANPTLGGDERFITWARETSFTDDFWGEQVEEAWVVVWPEHLGSAEFCAGVDLNALAAAYEDITGKPLPIPPPQPTPVDPPSPVPGPAAPPHLVAELEAIFERVKNAAEADIRRLIAFAREHGF